MTEIDPCSAVFGGEEPFSEIESRHVRDAILERKDDLVLYVSLQSHDRAIILPGMQDTQNHNYHYEQQVTVIYARIFSSHLFICHWGYPGLLKKGHTEVCLYHR